MSDNGDDSFGDVESLVPYDEWMIDGMRRIMYLALWQTAEHGLLGDHHYMITFQTHYPGSYLSPSLQARFPKEMTVVIQHQYGNLEVDEDGFSISLQFGGVPETIVVPFKSITQFVDPAVHFTLEFDVDIEDAMAHEAEKTSGPRLVNTEGNVAHLGPRPTKGTQSKSGQKQTQKLADDASSASPLGGDGLQRSDSISNAASPNDIEKVVTLDAFRQKKKED